MIRKSTTADKKIKPGVPVMAQWLTNPTSIHKDTGLIPGLAQSRICLAVAVV